MKRLICLVLAVVCLMPAAGAEEENWYLKTAEEMAACVGLLAGDEGYRSVLTSAELEGAQALREAILKISEAKPALAAIYAGEKLSAQLRLQCVDLFGHGLRGDEHLLRGSRETAGLRGF